MSKAKTPTATLVRGETYRLQTADGFRLFQKGRPETVSELEKELLAKAVDAVTIYDPEAPNGLRHRHAAKFTFS